MAGSSETLLFKTLAEFLVSKHPDFDAIFRHGIEAAEEGGHRAVADYFMMVSEIESMPAPARDLAIDLSVHYSGVGMYKNFDPAAEYRKRSSAWLDGGPQHS
jgi:hypothetical protein